MEYQHAADFIRLGEEAAEQVIGAIKQKLFATENERV
jgi:hypothetical protein